MHTELQHELEFELALSPERGIRVPAGLGYRTDDPYAVHITFRIASASASPPRTLRAGPSPANCWSKGCSGRAGTGMCGCGRRRSGATASS
jgi:hypothetical protein